MFDFQGINNFSHFAQPYVPKKKGFIVMPQELGNNIE
jgi:hypothetical protein